MKKRVQLLKTTTVFLSGTAMLLSFSYVQAQNADFPFDEIPGETFSTTINVTGRTTPFNNLLLGSNVDANAAPINSLRLNSAPLLGPGGNVIRASQGAQGFNSQFAQDFLDSNTTDPVVIRFPQGVFANSYNWEQVRDSRGNVLAEADSRNIVDPFPVRDTIRHNSPATVRLGYPALRGIFDRAAAENRPLDLLTVLNVVSNDGVSNGERWESMIRDGFDVQDMELGNEFFFLGQRSGTINTEAQWVDRARRIVTNIRGRAARLNRTVRFGIPITYRASDPTEPEARQISDQAFNDAITQDESIFDAIVVHRYVREQREDGVLPRQLTRNNFRRLLLASRIMDVSLTYTKTQVSDDKDAIWLTEWGVAGSARERVGAAVLGTADTYSHLIRNQRRLEMERINWFSTFGSNAQFEFDDRGRRTTTSYGRVYQMFRRVLKNSGLYEETLVTTANLVNNGTVASRAVNALAVSRGDRRITYLVTNLANKPTILSLRRDGELLSSFNVRISGVSPNTLRSLDVEVLDAVTRNNQNTIRIPPYSVMQVEVTFDSSVAKTISNIDGLKKDITSPVIIYPNPTSSFFNIVFKDMKTAHVVINDLLGKVVFNKVTTNGQLQLNTTNQFKPGVYIVKVIDQNNKAHISKLVVK